MRSLPVVAHTLGLVSPETGRHQGLACRQTATPEDDTRTLAGLMEAPGLPWLGLSCWSLEGWPLTDVTPRVTSY